MQPVLCRHRAVSLKYSMILFFWCHFGVFSLEETAATLWLTTVCWTVLLLNDFMLVILLWPTLDFWRLATLLGYKPQTSFKYSTDCCTMVLTHFHTELNISQRSCPDDGKLDVKSSLTHPKCSQRGWRFKNLSVSIWARWILDQGRKIFTDIKTWSFSKAGSQLTPEINSRQHLTWCV